jgi:hypothetical protein
VRFDLALAIETLCEELVKFFVELEERGRVSVLLGLLCLVVHCSPFVAYYAWRAGVDRLPESQP